jgi:hypothetical protein
LIATSLAACGDNTQPGPPDITELERAYAAPTATVDDPARLGALATTILRLDRALGRSETVIDGTAAVLPDPAADPADSAEPLPFDLQGSGVAKITHVCPGWPEHEARRADVSGQLALSVRFELGTLVPVLWGVADHCAFVVDDRRVMIDGDLIVAKAGRGILVALTGLLEADGELLVDDTLDFVVHADGVDYRRQLDDGHVVITVGFDGRLVVHAVDGDFTCDTERCSRIAQPAGGSR